MTVNRNVYATSIESTTKLNTASWTRKMSVPNWEHGNKLDFDTITTSVGSSSLAYNARRIQNISAKSVLCVLTWNAVFQLLPVGGEVHYDFSILSTGDVLLFMSCATLPGETTAYASSNISLVLAPGEQFYCTASGQNGQHGTTVINGLAASTNLLHCIEIVLD